MSLQKLSDDLAAAIATSSSDSGSSDIPEALLVIQLMPHTLKPQWTAVMASQAVLIPTASAPKAVSYTHLTLPTIVGV